MSIKQIKKERRQKKIRARMHGTAARPRLSVFRSINHIYVQLIDDNSGKVLAIASDKDLKAAKKSKAEIAKEVGKAIAKAAAEKKIDSVVFDRSGFLFHGRVKSLAEGAREGGLKF